MVKILIVDDENIMRNMLCDVLTEEGYKVYSANCAAAALELIKNHHFSLIITDIVMRGTDGIELISAARKIDPEAEFIVMTAYATPITIEQSTALGAISYLTKPLEINQVKVLVSRIIGKSDAISNSPE